LILTAAPISIPPVALGLLWRLLLEADGPTAKFFELVGLKLPPLLSTKPVFGYDNTLNWSYISDLSVDTWMWMPLLVSLLLIACRRISDSIIDAARIDCSSDNQIFWRIQLPLITNWIAWLWLFRFIYLFRLHDTHWILFKNLIVIKLVSIDVYDLTIVTNHYREGALVAVSTIVVSITVLFVIYFVQRTFLKQSST